MQQTTTYTGMAFAANAVMAFGFVDFDGARINLGMNLS